MNDILTVVFSDSKLANDIHLHRTKCTDIIREVIGSHYANEIVKDIGDQNFRVRLDESTDIVVTKMLGMVVRYLSISPKKSYQHSWQWFNLDQQQL